MVGSLAGSVVRTQSTAQLAFTGFAELSNIRWFVEDRDTLEYGVGNQKEEEIAKGATRDQHLMNHGRTDRK
jgi:hypothetical protein